MLRCLSYYGEGQTCINATACFSAFSKSTKPYAPVSLSTCRNRKMTHSVPEKDVAPAYSVDSAPNSSTDEGSRLRGNPWWRFGGEDRSFVPVNVPSSVKSTRSSSDEGEHANENTIYGSVFSDSRAQEFYKPIEKYEGRHRFDMHATWSEQEEKSLVRRVSSCILASTTTTRHRLT